VSIAFDDVPLSAYEHGLPILEGREVKASFYVALNMNSDLDEEFLGPSEILELYSRGHEIACHTYNHYRLSTGDVDGLALDAERNRVQLSRLLGVGPKSFAFPYGDLSLAAKARLQDSYQSLRSSRPGVNHGSIDLNCLKAYSLGAANSTQTYIKELLEKAEQRKGWLILYTHGVSPNPGRYDIRPKMLEYILSECCARRMDILPVAHAVKLMVASLVAPPFSTSTARWRSGS
jgi:peptidoglycan/xylan/chitin deacetylase (PgdA/CDA1 family)